MTTERELIRELRDALSVSYDHEFNSRNFAEQIAKADAYLATPEVDAMFGQMSEVDFDSDTITFKMEPGYHAAAGRFKIVRTVAQQQEIKT